MRLHRNIAYLVLLSSLFLPFNIVHADYFQILEPHQDSYVTFSPVYISGNLYRYTDKYGRIIINLPQGRYDAEIVYRGERRRIVLNVDGDQRIKIIYLQ